MIEKLIKDRHRELRSTSLKVVADSFQDLPYDFAVNIIVKGN